MKPVTRSFVLAAAIAMMVSCSSAQAGIMVGDYQNLGDGLLTIDTDTGLEWLDWTESTNISYDTIITQFGVGDTYDGWRHATLDEVRLLLSNTDIGLPTGSWPHASGSLDGGNSALRALSYVGITYTDIGFNYAYAVTSDTTLGGGNAYVTILENTGILSIVDASGSTSSSGGNSTFGHALVRSTPTNAAPEPTSLMCWLGLGLVGLTRRRRNQ